MWQLIKEDITCIFERDPAARNLFDVLTCYSGVHAMLFYRLTHWLWLRKFRWAARFLSNLSRWFTGIEIHPGAQIGRRFFVDHGTGVVIGETSEIGDDVTLYQGVTLGGRSLSEGKRHPTLGNNVVVGAGAKILGPFTVGEDARVGSNAVVLEEVPAGATVVGIPARVVKCAEPSAECLELVNQRKSAKEFDAYGEVVDAEDPLLVGMEQMQQQINMLVQQVNELKQQDNALGSELGSTNEAASSRSGAVGN